MKIIGLILAILTIIAFSIAAYLALGTPADAAECLDSPHAVWHIHPGSHAMWSRRLPGHEGHKCWFVGRPHHHRIPVPRERVEAAPPAPVPVAAAAAPAARETFTSVDRGISIAAAPARTVSLTFDEAWDERVTAPLDPWPVEWKAFGE